MGFHMSGKILDAVFTSKRFVTLCTIKVGIYMLIQVLFFICLKLALKALKTIGLIFINLCAGRWHCLTQRKKGQTIWRLVTLNSELKNCEKINKGGENIIRANFK